MGYNGKPPRAPKYWEVASAQELIDRISQLEKIMLAKDLGVPWFEMLEEYLREYKPLDQAISIRPSPPMPSCPPVWDTVYH